MRIARRCSDCYHITDSRKEEITNPAGGTIGRYFCPVWDITVYSWNYCDDHIRPDEYKEAMK